MKLINGVLVGILGVYGIAGIEFKGMPVDPDRLFAFTDQVHLDPPPDAVVEGIMSEGLRVKIARQITIYSLQYIQIECGGDAAGIIVGRIQSVLIL